MSNNSSLKVTAPIKGSSRASSRMMALESRFVFDAAIGAELHHQMVDVDLNSSTATQHHDTSESVATAARTLMASNGNDNNVQADSADRNLAGLIDGHNSVSAQTEIAFIDSRLLDIETLVADIPDHVRIVLIDPSRDGVVQMMSALQGASDVSAIHVISHGSAGQLELGSSIIDEASMSTVYRQAFASMRGNLSSDADIFVYGCNFGAGATGARAAGMLAQLTGADVAASVNLTGGAAGADWELEVATGTIDEASLVSAGWNHELLDITSTDGSASGFKNTPITGNLASQVTVANPSAPAFFTVQTITTAHGSVSIAANGDYTFTPTTGYTGTDSFIFEASATDPADGVTQTTTSVETITISPNPGYVISAADETDAVGYERSFSGTVVDNVTPSTLGGPITTYTKTSGPSHGTLTFNADGTFTYQPDAGYSGADSFTFSADDADPNSDAASATVFLNVANPPLLTYDYDSYAVNNNPVTVTPPVSEADGAATLTYAAGSSANGTLVANGDGTFTFNPTPGFTGDTSATYTVTDSNGYVSTSTLYFHYSATGIPPLSASPDTYTIKQGDTVSQGLAYFETNKNGVAPTYTITHTNPAHGTITNFNPATGSYNYIADPGYLGPDSFSFTVVDQDGQMVTSTESINIVKPDLAVDASVKFAAIGAAVPGNLGGETHESAGNTTEVYSIGGTPLVNGATINTAHGVVTVINAATGAYSWQPNPGFSGVETIDWSVKNVWGPGANDFYDVKSSTDTIVSPNKIFAGHRGYAIPENSTKTGTVADFSGTPNGTPSYTPTFAAAHGTATVNADGTYSYTPTPGYHGIDKFGYKVANGLGNTATGYVTIYIAGPLVPGDIAPVATAIPDQVHLDADVPVGISVASSFSDVDGDTLTFVADGLPPGLTMAADGTISGTIDKSASQGGDFADGRYTVTVFADDGRGGVTQQTFSWTVSNPAPVADTETISTPYNTAVIVDLLNNDSDPDGDVLTVTSASVDPSEGTVAFNGTDWVFTPSASFKGTATVTYSISDGEGGTATSTHKIVVAAPPIAAVDDSYTTPYDTDLAGNAATGDTYAPGSVFVATSTPANGTVTMNAIGTYTYNPNYGFAGVDTFTYKVTDPTGQVVTATETITITPPAIAAVDDSYTTPYDTDLAGNAATGDTYAPGSVFVATSTPANGTVTMNANGTYTYNPNYGFAGVDTFTYKVTDPTGQVVTATETITITPPAIAAVDDSYTTPYDTDLAGNAATGDTYAPGSVFVATSTPANGTVTMNANGTYTYNPNFGFAGVDTFTYKVTDPTGQVVTATETITITPPAIAAVDDSYTTPYDTNVAGDAATGDTYAPGSVFVATSTPAHGTVAMNANGTYTYNPDPNFAGVDTFTYKVTDPTGQVVTATETITITPPAIAAVDDNYTTPYDTNLAGNAATGDTFTPGSVFVATSTPAHGTVTMNANGTYTYNPDPNFSGVDSFTYKVTDPTGQVVTATEFITVNPPGLNATDDSYTTPYNTPLAGNAATGDTFVTGSTFAATSSPANGTVTMNTNGTYTYTPTPGFVGTDTFTYKITDPTGQVVTATETITITQPVLIAVSDSFTTPYNTPLTANAGAGDTYVTGSTFAATSAPTSGTVTMNANGTYTYRPALGFTGTVTFTYTVTDPTGNTKTATETIKVSPPLTVAVSHSNLTPLDKPYAGNAALGNTFATGSKFSVVGRPTSGTVTMTPDGKYVFKPVKGFTGTATFKYQIKDPTGRIVTATETIKIEPRSIIQHCLTTFGKFSGLLVKR